MSHTPSSAPRALSAGEALLLKARVFVDYVASCGNAEAHELVHAIDAHLSAAPARAVEIDGRLIELLAAAPLPDDDARHTYGA